MNAVTEHAIKLSKGQINPPRFFDPTLLSPPITEPAPIPLIKKNVQGPAPAPAPNAMPNLVGQLADPVIRLLACIQLEPVDHCLNFVGSSLNGLGLDPRELGNFFFVILRSGVKAEVSGGQSERPGARIRSQFPPPGVPVEPLTIMKLEVDH